MKKGDIDAMEAKLFKNILKNAKSIFIQANVNIMNSTSIVRKVVVSIDRGEWGLTTSQRLDNIL